MISHKLIFYSNQTATKCNVRPAWLHVREIDMELSTRIRHRDPWQSYGPLPRQDVESLLAAKV